MEQDEIQWTPATQVRVTDAEGRAVDRVDARQAVPRISRIRITAQIGKDGTIVTIMTEGLRGRWVWSKRRAIALLSLTRHELDSKGVEPFIADLVDALRLAIGRSRW